LTATLNVGWLTKQASAARPKCCSCASATMYRNSVSVTASVRRKYRLIVALLSRRPQACVPGDRQSRDRVDVLVCSQAHEIRSTLKLVFSRSTKPTQEEIQPWN
jgi:hypothetical protein